MEIGHIVTRGEAAMGPDLTGSIRPCQDPWDHLERQLRERDVPVDVFPFNGDLFGDHYSPPKRSMPRRFQPPTRADRCGG